jgi:hypothetical protein
MILAQGRDTVQAGFTPCDGFCICYDRVVMGKFGKSLHDFLFLIKKRHGLVEKIDKE